MGSKNCIVCDIKLNGNRLKFCGSKCSAKFKYDKNKKQLNANSYSRQQKVYKERKIHLIKLLGGCCENCGYDKNISALEFNHIDPSTKNFSIDSRHISNLKLDALYEELNKCNLLCANCHREYHNPELDKKNLNYDCDLKKVGKPKCVGCDKEISYGNLHCKKCAAKKRQTVERPEYDVLIKDIEEFGYVGTGKKYGVSDNTIRKWKNNF